MPYVDSASDFSHGPGRCGDKFFCVVYDIVHKHRNATQHGEHKALMRSLNNTISHKNINCTIVMENPQNTTVWLKMSDFLSDIKRCVQCRMLNLTSPSCSD
ncbi:hypothetical protein NQD34_010172 [Periophthalmus magnuspinnatus]|nr:hypothetical protein NQD34_010172 [Periophthalmus magnuspinnatus]